MRRRTMAGSMRGGSMRRSCSLGYWRGRLPLSAKIDAAVERGRGRSAIDVIIDLALAMPVMPSFGESSYNRRRPGDRGAAKPSATGLFLFRECASGIQINCVEE